MDASQNHSKTIESVYSRYADMLYRLAYSHLSSAHDAEDAVADVFVKYIQSQPLFRDESHEKAWLIRVLINQCKDQQRRSAVRAYTPLEDVAQIKSAPEESKELLQAVQRLPEKNRTAMLLHYFEGFSLEETAAILKTTVPAVKMRLMRGRTALKSLLKGGRGV